LRRCIAADNQQLNTAQLKHTRCFIANALMKQVVNVVNNPTAHEIAPLEMIGREVMQAVAELQPADVIVPEAVPQLTPALCRVTTLFCTVTVL
jgi:hypothetical protein